MSIAARGTGTATALSLDNGATAVVSAANEARIRYNTALSRAEISENGGAYVPFGASGSVWSRTAGGHIYPTTLTDTFGFAITATVPNIFQETDIATGGVRPAFSMHAQDTTVALGTGGDFIVRPGHGATHGRFVVRDADDVTERIAINANGDTIVGSASSRWTAIQAADGSGISLQSGAHAWLFAYLNTLQMGASNLYWTSAIAAPSLYQDTDTVTGGVRPALSMHAQDTTVALGTGADFTIRPGHGATHGALNLNSAEGTARVTVDAGGNVSIAPASNFQITMGTVYLDGSVIQFGQSSLQFRSSTINPIVNQQADATAGVVADNLTIQAQATSDATVANTAGTLNLFGGNSAGPLASIGGSVVVQAGNATLGGVGSNGGHVYVWYGTGATNGYIAMGVTGSTIGASGALRVPDTFNATWRSGGGVDYALWSAQATHAYIGGAYPTKPTNIYVDASAVVGLTAGGQNMVLSTYLLLNFGNVAFGGTTGAPLLNQNDRTAAGGTAYTYTVCAQHATDATVANTAGSLELLGGTSSGPLASVGGSATLRAGSVTLAGVGSVGGSAVVEAGLGATNGHIKMGWSGATYPTAGALRVPDTFNVTSVTGGVNQALVSAQGTTVYVGGAYPVRPVSAYLNGGTSTVLLTGAAASVTLWGTSLSVSVPTISFATAAAGPTVTQAVDSTDATTCDDLSIIAQGASGAAGTSKAGNLGLSGGKGTVAAGNLDGNVWFHTSPGAFATWQSGEMIMHIGNAVTEPLAVDATGAFLWAFGNNLKTNAPLLVGDAATLPTTGDIGLPSNFTMVVKSSTGEATFLAVNAGDDTHLGSNDTDLDDLYLDVATMQSIFATVAGVTKLTLSGTTFTVDADIVLNKGVYQKGTDVHHTASPYTILGSDSVLRCNTDGAVLTVTLPAVASSVDRRITILDWFGNAAAMPITIGVTDSTINGVATVTINTNFGGAECYCDGVVWRTLQATV